MKPKSDPFGGRSFSLVRAQGFRVVRRAGFALKRAGWSASGNGCWPGTAPWERLPAQGTPPGTIPKENVSAGTVEISRGPLRERNIIPAGAVFGKRSFPQGRLRAVVHFPREIGAPSVAPAGACVPLTARWVCVVPAGALKRYTLRMSWGDGSRKDTYGQVGRIGNGCNP